jgi:type II secretory pathway pseudopilin PulG
MSKDRARRREAREAEAAVLRARRERQRQRDARRRGRRAALRKWLTPLTTGRQTGVLAQRRRTRLNLVVASLLFIQVVVWIVRPDWPARLTALIIAALAFPVIAAFTL